MGVRWPLKFGVRARVRGGLSGLARRSRLAWTGEEQLRLAMAEPRKPNLRKGRFDAGSVIGPQA